MPGPAASATSVGAGSPRGGGGSSPRAGLCQQLEVWQSRRADCKLACTLIWELIVNLLRRRRCETACREGSHQEWWLCQGWRHQQWRHVEVLHRWQSWNQGLSCQPVSSPSQKDNFFSFDINIGLILICSRQFHSRLVQFQCLWCPCCSLPVYSCSISGASTTGPRPISH